MLVDVSAPAYADAEKVNANFAAIEGALANLSTSGVRVNVKDYGAVGDGVTNDTAAIQSAIDAAAGGVVWFPAGVYRAGTVNMGSNITLDGEGRGASILKLRDGVNVPLLKSGVASNIHIRNLGFDGNKANNPLVGHPVEFDTVTSSSITHCAVYNSRQNGIRWDGCTGNLIAFNHVYDNEFCGIRCGETGTSLHTRIIGNYCLNNGLIGVSVDSVSRFVISSNVCNNNAEMNGIDLCASNECVVSGNVCLSNYAAGIAVDGWTYPGKNCDDNVITGNVCMYNGQYGFDTANGNNRLIVAGNNLYNNTLGPFRDTGTGYSKTVKDNKGWATTNSGVAQVPSGATSVVVSHGLSITPDASKIQLTRSSNGGTSGNYWFSDITSTTFKINVAANPGTGGAWFVWAILD